MTVATSNIIEGRNWRVYVGDVLDTMRTLPDCSVHCCVTSPPYFGLRDYGTGTWEGGDDKCQHKVRERSSAGTSTLDGSKATCSHSQEGFRDICQRCGARRIDRQIGLESSPAEFVAKMVEVFAEVRRVLRDDGVCFVNMGDSYASAWPCNRRNEVGAGSLPNGKREARPPRMGDGLKEKDLMGVPWRLAFALQADGWYLRQDIIWHKRSPMPESVTDRCTKAHEYIFLLTKRDRYFWDQEAVREPGLSPEMSIADYSDALEATSEAWYPRVDVGVRENGAKQDNNLTSGKCPPGGRNLRSVWTLSSEPYAEAHFATFPSEIPRRCIKAGTSEKGCCAECGAPWRRITEKAKRTRQRPNDYVKPRKHAATKARNGSTSMLNSCSNRTAGVAVQTTGWEPTCKCGADIVPCTVLDCFSGSGTTGMVATELGRAYIGCELNPAYAEMSRKRIESWKYRDVEKQPEPLVGQMGLAFD